MQAAGDFLIFLLWSGPLCKKTCLICVIHVLRLSCFRVCSLLPCGHLKGKGWLLGICLWSLLGFCYFRMWYPGTGVVFDCIDSWSLLSILLWLMQTTKRRPACAFAQSGQRLCYLLRVKHSSLAYSMEISKR